MNSFSATMKNIEMKTFLQCAALFVAFWLCASYIASSSLAGTQAQKKQERKASEPISPEELARTRTLFNEKCARCHGEDGRGETRSGSMLGVPDFTDEKWWKETKGDKRFITSVTDGKDAMPAFGKKLSKQEIATLVAYARLFGKAAH